MSISFPTSLDNFTNPTGADSLSTALVLHSTQHSNENDAIEALEAKVGADGSAVTSSHDFKLSGITGSNKAASTANFTGTSSGVNSGDQTISLTGGVTGSGTGSFAATVVTNANLTGPVTSTGNATAIANGAITNAMLANAAVANLSGTNSGDQTISLTGGVTGSGAGSFAATVVTNANLTGVITSVGNATSIASQTGTGTKFVVDNAPTLIAPILGAATATSVNKLTITSPATGATLTVDDGFTLHATGNVTALSGSHTGASSNTNTGDQTITLTGGVTGSGTGSFAATVITNANLTGDVTSVGNASTLVSASSIFAFTGVISPTALAGNTNDWAPTSLSTANTIRISASNAFNLTGLTGGAAGRILFVENVGVGANTITLKANDSNSSAANRFAINTDIRLVPGACVVLQYDGTSSRWRSMGLSGTINIPTNALHIVDSTDNTKSIDFNLSGFGTATGNTLTIQSGGNHIVAGLNIPQTFTASQSISTAGLSNIPAMSWTGAIFTGGDATTTKPLALIESGAPNSNAWSTTGTALGINIATGFVGKLVDWQMNAVSKFSVDYTGAIIGTSISTRVKPRTGTTTSSATPTINTDNVDMYLITAQAADITSFSTNLSGTPTEGQKLWIAITGTAARAITWGASFESSTVTLPTTTVTTNRLDVGFVYNTVTSKFRCIAVA